MAKHRIGIVGLGKIAHDQHVPAIRGNPAFDLVAVSSQRGLAVEGAAHAFTDYRDLLRLEDVDAVAISTPPGPRHAIARAALQAGKHVLLEKPPTATLSELADLERAAAEAGRTLFATWHAQHNAAVEAARKALYGRTVKRLAVTWEEDVRHWHPGQQWIWEPGGFGVFDPGINALSILSRVLPNPIFIRSAELQFPANKAAPIAAELAFRSGQAEEDLRASFDWRQTGPQIWDIELTITDGTALTLSKGGSRLAVNGKRVVDEAPAEYSGIYRRFDELIAARQSEVDAVPFRLVADAFMIGRRVTVEPFIE
jgi:D-galactose 1-dehydrogenase